MKSIVFLLMLTASFSIFTIKGQRVPPRYVVKYKFGFNKNVSEMPFLEEKIVIDDVKAASIKRCLIPFKRNENPHFKTIEFDRFSNEYIRCIMETIAPPVNPESVRFTRKSSFAYMYSTSSNYEKFVPVYVYKKTSTLVDEVCSTIGINTKQYDYGLKIESTSPPTPLRDPRKAQVDCTANENDAKAKTNNEFTKDLATERGAEVTMTESDSWEFKAGFEFALEKIGLSMGGGFGVGGGTESEKAEATSTLKQLTIGGKYDTANKSVNVVSHAFYEKQIEKDFSMEIIVKGWLYVARGLQRYWQNHMNFFSDSGKEEDPNKFKYEYLYAFPVGDMAYFFDEYFTRVNAHSLIYKLYGVIKEKVVDNYIRAEEFKYGSVECHKKK
uniref:Scol-BPFTx n=1 Tax=Scolopendra viridis TaxID=118503 RepID=A0A4D5R951_SCOVI